MTDKTHAGAESVIAAFLQEVSEPTAKDWDGLIMSFPQYAADIVDAALVEKSRIAFEDGRDAELVEGGEVFSRTASKAINLVYARPSPQLKAAQEQIYSFQGSAIRGLCAELAIPHPALLSGVLAGTIRAPTELLKRLGERLDVPIAALREIFSQSFRIRNVPAYKSEEGKPSVATQPTSWEEAVRTLRLTEEETKSLLAWDSQSR